MMLSKLKSLGPGLLYAGAAIGVSHLVQSTRAGAEYGYILVVAIILAHVFKYPFFALGPKYATESGESLVAGYARLGKATLLLLAFITLSTMFTVQAAVTIVTAGLVQKMTGWTFSAPVISAFLIVVCFFILRIGKFNVLDHLMKVIMVVLSISTLLAFVFSFQVEKDTLESSMQVFDIKSDKDLSFLLAFVGWMPAPMDIAIWHSIWTISSSSKRSSVFDFRVGFYGTALLGICFLILGANTLYGTGTELESSAVGFASQLVDVFTVSLGSWSYWPIMIAAFTTMFSTTLTCYDALPRVMAHIGLEFKSSQASNTTLWRIVLGIGALLILFFFVSNMREMVNFATIISFLTAPILAFLSYRLVLLRNTELQLWGRWEKSLALVGIGVLFLFSIRYLMLIL